MGPIRLIVVCLSVCLALAFSIPGEVLAVCPDFVTPNLNRVGQGANAVAIADFNGDGLSDLAVANESSNSVSILLGKSDGTFARSFGQAAGAGSFSLVVGDFNGDGKSDLAVACAVVDTPIGPAPDAVLILLNASVCFPTRHRAAGSLEDP